MAEKNEVREIEGVDTSENKFEVCGGGCGEFFGCISPKGKYTSCQSCGFGQKFTCASTIDRLNEDGATDQMILMGESCNFCPTGETSPEDMPASMSAA